MLGEDSFFCATLVNATTWLNLIWEPKVQYIKNYTRKKNFPK